MYWSSNGQSGLVPTSRAPAAGASPNGSSSARSGQSSANTSWMPSILSATFSMTCVSDLVRGTLSDLISFANVLGNNGSTELVAPRRVTSPVTGSQMKPALAQHAFGGFERRTEDPVGLAVVADQRTVGEGEISLPAATCGHHRQHQVVRPGCFAGRDDAGQHRADRLPDIPPGVLSPLTQGFRVPVTEDRDVGVVVDQEQILGTQPQHDRKARCQHHRDRGPHSPLPPQ